MLVVVAVVVRRNEFVSVDVVVVVDHHLLLLLVIVERKFREAAAAPHLLLMHDGEGTAAFWRRWRQQRSVGVLRLVFYRQLAHLLVQLRQHLIRVRVVDRDFRQVLRLWSEARDFRVLGW